jgi:uncharacterized protein YndB with AHSA1/START domain
MSESAIAPSVIHDTFVIERHFPVAPDRVFTALSDPGSRRRWYAEGESHDVESFTTELRVGGHERTRYRLNEATPFPGTVLSNDTLFHDVVPGRRIVASSTMELAECRISVSLETFELLPAADGTELVFTHQGAFFEGSDGPEMRASGWRSLLDRLAAQLGV